MEDTPATAFVRALARSGFTLADLLSGLVEACDEAHAFPGEDAASVVVEMAAGSLETRLRRVPPAEFERSAALIEWALEAILADLATAAEIASRRANGFRMSDAQT